MLPHIHQPYKPQSHGYESIILQGMLIHTIHEDEKLFHCQTNQLLGMRVTESDNISYSITQNEPSSSHM